MSTLAATTRHTTLNLGLNTANAERLTPTPTPQATSSTALPLSSLRRLQVNMHPDCLLLAQHGVTSPRLLGNNEMHRRQDNEKHELAKMPSEEDTEDVDMSACATPIVIDEEEEDEVAVRHENDDEDEDEDNEDAASYCSEGSVLSVGQEQQQQQTHATQRQQQQQQQLLMSTLYRPSAFSSVSSNDTTSGSMEHEAGGGSAASSPTSAAQLIDPLAVVHALRAGAATTAATTHASPFQEEFLRKSQIYAEELMKQQMQLMAAARVNALTLRSAAAVARATVPSVLPLGYRALPSNAMTETQLSAISKMSQFAAAAAAASHNAQPPSDALAKLTATALGIAPDSASSSKLNQLQAQLHGQLPFQLHHNNNDNNNLHESALKFSIDNILKADFGSRLQPRPASVDSSSTRNSSPGSIVIPPVANCRRSAAKPLNLAASAAPPTSTMSYTSTLANICTNSNDSCSTAASSALDLAKSPGDFTAEDGKSTEANTSNGTTTAGAATTTSTSSGGSGTPMVWPAWVYCTRYSDRPSSGRSPRTRKPKKSASASNGGIGGGSGGGGGVGGTNAEKSESDGGAASTPEDKRPRTAFSGSQLARLKHEFNENRYLTEKRRQHLSAELGLNEAQIKIWFQNKRAKLKKSSGTKNPLALQLMAQGLYNHSTVPLTREEEELQELQERERERETAASSSSTAS